MTEIPNYLLSPTCWALFFGSLFTTAVLTPIAMWLARRFGAVDTGGHRRVTVGSIPLLGGLAIALPFVGVCLLGYLGVTSIFLLVEAMRPQFLVLAIGCTAIVALGVVDDTLGMRARYKLAGQILIALSVVLAGDVLEVIRLPLLGTVEISPGVGVLLGTLWVVGLINAINIIDGIDGLASGISLIATVGLLALAAMGGYTFVVLLCFALAGSLLGFLPYNFHPATIFLGDTGSMFLGFVLASITLMGTYKSETAVIVLAPLLALGFPIFETLLSMTRRIIRGTPVFVGDAHHTHHRLLSRGYSQRRVVLLLYAVAGIFTSLAMMSRVAPAGSAWEWISLLIVAATLGGLVWLAGYLRVVPVNSVFQRRERNAVLQAFARYAVLSLRANRESVGPEELLKFACRELDLRHLSMRLDGEERRIGVAPGGDSDLPCEQLSIKTGDGRDLVVEYAFAGQPDRDTRHDVAACLARIFEESEFPTGIEEGPPSPLAGGDRRMAPTATGGSRRADTGGR